MSGTAAEAVRSARPQPSQPPVERLHRRWLRALAKLQLQFPRESIALLDYNRHPIRLSVSSAIEYHTRLHACAKEPETVAWIEDVFSLGEVFYDIGANVGTYALVAAAHWRGAVRVVAFEPSAFNFSRLVRNLSLNACGRYVMPLPVALGRTTQLSSFHYSTVVPGGALHALGDATDHRGASFEPTVSSAMLSFSLDTLIEQFELPSPTHVKLDVDGTELPILQGATQCLATVRSVLVELEEGRPEAAQVRALLAQQGFDGGEVHPYRFGHLHPEFQAMANVIFRRRKGA